MSVVHGEPRQAEPPDAMKRPIRSSPVAHLAPTIGDGELVAFNVGPDGATYLVVALKPLDYRIEQPASH